MKNKPILPYKWDSDLAYLFGLLIGDCSLPKSRTKGSNEKLQERYMIHFFSISKEFVEEIYNPLFVSLFNLTPKISIRKRENRKDLYDSRIESILVYKFLKEFGFTIGKKARIANVPDKLPKELRIYFLAGLLDTDGGKKGNGFGLSTASEHLAHFCICVFEELGLQYNSVTWHYKGHIYHQIYVRGSKMHKILERIPLRNKYKILYLKSKALVA